MDGEVTTTRPYYYGYYDSLIGRWPSKYPIEERGGNSLSGFVQNEGGDKWDFLGLETYTISGNVTLDDDVTRDLNGDHDRGIETFYAPHGRSLNTYNNLYCCCLVSEKM
jgi:hypothetical protein